MSYLVLARKYRPRTFAELAPEEKNRISHRAHALEKLVRDLF